MALKKHHEEAEEGEAWLMSYADLLSLLLAVFVLLFSMSSLDNEKITAVTSAVSRYISNKEILQNEVSDVTLVERQLQAYRLLTSFLDLGSTDDVLAKLLAMEEAPAEVTKLQKLAEKLGIMGTAQMKTPGLRHDFVIPNSAIFQPDSPYLTDGGVEVIEKLTPSLREILRDKSKTLEIVGHTDASPLNENSPFSSNHILSAARAEAVALIMVRDGISRDKINLVGKGGGEPLFPETTANGKPDLEAKKKNNRIVLSVVTTKD